LELPFVPLLAASPIEPLVGVLHKLLGSIDGVVHNFGWSLIILALLVKVVFWPLTTFQFKASLKTQQIMPRIKALQAKYKNDRERLNTETMALYKETGANPFVGCLPLIVQYPVLISLYWTIVSDKEAFATSTWLWIGSPLAAIVPFHALAGNLAQLDYLLLVLYAVSMYVMVRFTTPVTDEAMAQQQKIMAFISPAMIAFFAIKFQWYSALLIYWLSFNLFSIGQQLYLINKYHRNPAPIGPHPEEPKSGGLEKLATAAAGANLGTAKPVGNGSGGRASGAKRRRARR
jgi:YidC/Oxa1 family membrane protein insertase